MERLPLYAAAAERLLAADQAYPCYCTPEELEADRKAQEAAKQPPRYVGRCAALTRRGARRPRGRGPPRRAPLPGRGGRRRLRRHRPRPRRDRRREPRRRLRHRPRRRHAAVPLHGRRRRRGDGDQPRHPRRGPPLEHAQAHPAVPGARLRRCRCSPTCRSSSTRTGRKMSKRKSQTAVADYIAQGFIREALVNYLALLGWSTGHGGGGLLARRARRAVRPRRASTRAAPCSTASGSSGSTASGSAGSTPDDLVERLRPFLEAELARRPDRPACPSDDELRVAAADRPGAAADARRDRRPRRLPVGRGADASIRPCSCRSAGTRRRRARA